MVTTKELADYYGEIFKASEADKHQTNFAYKERKSIENFKG